MRALRGELEQLLRGAGFAVGEREGDLDCTPLRLRLLGALLRAAEDPDDRLADFAAGVRVGVGVRMPRLPAIYPKKGKWSLPEQREAKLAGDFGDCSGQSDPVLGNFGCNYHSAQVLAEEVELALEEQVRKGQVIRMDEEEARARWGAATT